MRFAELDAVTVDGYGTLLELADPVPRLTLALRREGIERQPDAVAAAFRAEAAYYRKHAEIARDPATLRGLREECTRVFLEEAKADLDPAAFSPAYVEALVFRPIPGALETLRSLAARGLALAVVANWDPSLRDHLEEAGMSGSFAAVVVSAEVGARKPHPEPFRAALRALGVPASRALHVGDDETDELGARAAGMRFAPAPLADAFAGWS